jgi:hypothetical protein
MMILSEAAIHIANSVLSNYVQLSRIKSLDGLHLFQCIQMSDLNFQPHPDMLAEMSRLQKLQEQTLSGTANVIINPGVPIKKVSA